VAVLSLDDFYLTRAHRLRIAARLHPLFETRGVPGTHDVPLLLRTLDALLDGGPSVPVPRFDKAVDDRSPTSEQVPAPVDVVLLEGWCLAVPPEPPSRLAAPCNELEAAQDQDGRFRRCVNHRMAHDYATLARRVDWLLALMVESFDVSREHRLAQERQLRARSGGGMSDAEVAAFMQRFERVSRWALATMGERADLAVALNDAHLPSQAIPQAPVSPRGGR
jgi:D-glycerate 3-kinase